MSRLAGGYCSGGIFALIQAAYIKLHQVGICSDNEGVMGSKELCHAIEMAGRFRYLFMQLQVMLSYSTICMQSRYLECMVSLELLKRRW